MPTHNHYSKSNSKFKRLMELGDVAIAKLPSSYYDKILPS